MTVIAAVEFDDLERVGGWVGGWLIGCVEEEETF